MNSRTADELSRAPIPRAALSPWLSFALTTAFISSAPTVAMAAGSVGVLVTGPGAEGIRAELVAALPPDTAAVDQAKVSDALLHQQVAEPGKAILAANHGQALLGPARKAAANIGADAVILGAVRPGKGKRPSELVLMVVVAAQDLAAVDQAVPLKKGANRRDQWKALLAPPLEGIHPAAAAAVAAAPASPPPPPEKSEKAKEGEAAATPETPTAKAAEAPSEPGESGKSWFQPTTVPEAMFVGFLAFDLGGRQFHYNDRVTFNTLPYDLPSGLLVPETPGVRGQVEFYPLARGKQDIARDVGVSARVSTDAAKVRANGVVASTQWYAWELNVRGRIPLGPRATSPMLGVEGGGGELAFNFPTTATAFGAAGVADTLPSVDYKYLRLGTDGRVPFGKAAVLAGLAYRVVLGAGKLGDHFPHSSIAGLDANVGASYQLTDMLEARITLSYVRFWAAFNPKVGETYVAGGGLDQFVNADLGLVAMF